MTEQARYHPEQALLRQFVAGELNMGVNLAVSAHVEECTDCQLVMRAAQESLGAHWYREQAADAGGDDSGSAPDLDSLLPDILAQPAISPSRSSESQYTKASAEPIKMHDYLVELPRALEKIARQKLRWEEIGSGIHQALLDIDRDTKCEFISLEPGARVPRHSHFGYEAMLVLDGTITDDWDSYARSDFVMREQSDCHGQISENGCVCLFVTDAPLYFTEGLPRLLNPANWLKHHWRQAVRLIAGRQR